MSIELALDACFRRRASRHFVRAQEDKDKAILFGAADYSTAP